MITINFGETDVGALIKQALSQVPKQANKVMASALTGTAKEARDILANKAQETYTIKTVRFNKATQIKPATVSGMEAHIRAKGGPLPLRDFKFSAPRGGAVRAQVLRAGSLKPLELPGRKAFLTQFQSGHKAIAQRLGSGRVPVEARFGPSLPTMFGSLERVIDPTEPEISEILYRHVNDAIGSLLGGTA